jgi:hypothetical protein
VLLQPVGLEDLQREKVKIMSEISRVRWVIKIEWTRKRRLTSKRKRNEGTFPNQSNKKEKTIGMIQISKD